MKIIPRVKILLVFLVVLYTFTANSAEAYFTDSTQALGALSSRGVALGDVDGDGDLDAFVANYNQAGKVWVNDGAGSYTDSTQALGSSSSMSVSLGDVDGDGDLDAVVANWGAAQQGMA